MKSPLKAAIAAVALLGFVDPAKADMTFTVDPSYTWNGFMNVFELPANGGGYVFGSAWGTADLTAVFSGPLLTLGPNSVNDTSTFWYVGGGAPGAPGNKIMDANFYVEQTGTLNGQTITFTGIVLSNTFDANHQSWAFIRDYAPDYSSNVEIKVPLTPGTFGFSLATIDDPARHVQFGFLTTGVDVWPTDRGPVGNVVVTAIPEPSEYAATTAALLGLAILLRRRPQAGTRIFGRAES